MPQIISQEKELLRIIHNLQDKVEKLSGMFGESAHMDNQAFNELSIYNAQMYNEIMTIFQEIFSIKQTNWYANHTDDPHYQKRQVLRRVEKIGREGYKKCECGEWLRDIDRTFEDHQKRNCCVSGLMRKKYDTMNFKKSPSVELDMLLLLNNHINMVYHREEHFINPHNYSEKYADLKMLLRRRYIRNLSHGTPYAQLDWSSVHPH
tara:strand:+ start:1081 stop:1698 length:618 start_codon:yes stop_codon:yes gene_type:complete